MKKDLFIIFGLFFIIVVLIVFGQEFTTASFVNLRGDDNTTIGRAVDTIDIESKTLKIKAKVADKASERKKGLSKLEALPLDEGMLFVFETEGKYGFWMKDVKFAIDIVWLDKDKRVIEIIPNAPPQPKKKDRELTIYKPQADAKYVLEINAGLASFHNLQIGDTLNFKL